MLHYSTTSRRRAPRPPRHRGRGRVARLLRRAGAPGAAALALGTALSVGGVAAAYFTGTGTGTGTASVGTLEAPTAIAAGSTAGTGEVEVSWTAPASGATPDGYRVQRVPGDGPAVDACGTSASTTVPTTSCTDDAVPVGTWTYVVVAVHASWTATSAPSEPVTVGQASQAITFTSSPGSPAYGSADYTVTATGGASGNPVTFATTTPAVCTSAGTNGATISFVGAGTCTITADQAGDTYHSAAAQATQTFTVAKDTQVVTFSPAATADAGTTATLSATASSGLTTITFSTSSPATVCTVTGTQVSYVGVGTCVLTATQPGDANHAPASTSVGVTVQAVQTDTEPPVIVSVQPASGASGSWTGMGCSVSGSAARICVVATDDVEVASVRITLTKSNGRCWTGSTFDNATCPELDLQRSGSTWESGAALTWQNGNGQPNFTSGTYTLVVTVTDTAGRTTTQTTTFSINGS
ncbi:hypothetical protein L615_007500000110 [Nocardioides sp. J9]|uniref:hypothetical protein n=1 Tax=Nocardioides sp. J9 TaxID=935844 RepID=UPI00119D0534|nr:hypothetical protein [Nocardioides sp. J9]TWG92001.1 hypothetical protein L615_007500000110 [Nocardioides sp. J9]